MKSSVAIKIATIRFHPVTMPEVNLALDAWSLIIGLVLGIFIAFFAQYLNKILEWAGQAANHQQQQQQQQLITAGATMRQQLNEQLRLLQILQENTRDSR